MTPRESSPSNDIVASALSGFVDRPPPSSVAGLIEAARGGCQPSFGELSERCRTYLLHVANGELGADLQGKIGGSDLVQETLLRGSQGVGRFRGQTEAELLAWLREILLHTVADSGRHYRATAKRDIARELPIDDSVAMNRLSRELPADVSTPSKELMRGELVTALRQAIERLSAAHRQVIVLRNVEHLGFEAIGQTMQRTPEAVRKLWARALCALRLEMAAGDKSR